ncbi:MAG: FtsB family cell division protein [Alphaproteobacteria bacterium]
MQIRDFRRRLKNTLGPALSLCLVGYFGYHLIQGKRGVLAMQEITAHVDQSREHLQGLKAHQQKLEKRIGLLKSSSLCPDMLDERLRHMGYSDPNEIVVLHHND